MDETSALIAVAEIAVAVAGFSGVATALGNREDATFWSGFQRERFIDLLCHSGIALFASLVPLVFIYQHGATPELWLRSSLVWAFFGSIGTTFGALRNLRAAPSSLFPRILGIGVVSAFAMLVVLQLYNAFSLRAFWPYLGALVGNLGFAFIQFMRLVIPPRPDAPREE